MASLTIRKLPDDVKRRFRLRAAAHGRSMEDEARQLILDAAAEPTGGVAESQADYTIGKNREVEQQKAEEIGPFELLYRLTRPGFDLPEAPDTPASYAVFDE